MNSGCLEEGVIVHPVDGMQLSEGYIRKDASMRFVGYLPGMSDSVGETVEEVMIYLNRRAKDYYGDDVVVEIVHHVATV